MSRAAVQALDPARAASHYLEPGLFALLSPLRVLAMLSIVGYHMGQHEIFGVGFGLPFLQMVMCALVARRPRPESTRGLLARKAGRYLWPFVLWSAVYASYEILLAIRWGMDPFGWCHSAMLVGGAAQHLWFLPFALFSTLVVGLLMRVFCRMRDGSAILLAAGLGVAATIATPRVLGDTTWGWPFVQWISSVPTIPFGLALGRAAGIGCDDLRRRWLFVLIVVGMSPWLIGALQGNSVVEHGRIAMALLLVGAGLSWRFRQDPVSAFIAPLNLGVYAVHVLVATVLLRHVEFARDLDIIQLTLLVYSLSTLITLVLKRQRNWPMV